jgi:hypothetical protein
MSSNFIVSKPLQALADSRDSDEVRDQADFTWDLDDAEDTNQECVQFGLEKGIELAHRLQKVQRKTPGAGLYLLSYNNYGDDDGLMVFVGTKKSVTEALKSCSEGDDEEDEEDY